MPRFVLPGYPVLLGGNGCPLRCGPLGPLGMRLPLTSACAVISVHTDAYVGSRLAHTARDTPMSMTMKMSHSHACVWDPKRMRPHEACNMAIDQSN